MRAMTEAQPGISRLPSNPFSPLAFAERARLRGHGLDRAPWMTAQPLSYGVDAGREVDENDEIIDTRRLEEYFPLESWKKAAVLVPVLAKEPEATVLLTLRTSHLNSHGGQIAFPGGKIEKQDATPVDAALREAWEEVGLSPDLTTPLGLLDLHNTGTGYRIVPVLGLIDPAFVPRPEPGEVAETFEVPLSFLMQEQNHVKHYRQWRDKRILFYAMTYEQRFIWGATAAILRNMFERLYAPEAG